MVKNGPLLVTDLIILANHSKRQSHIKGVILVHLPSEHLTAAHNV